MAYQWYIESNGQKQGPYSSADLKRFADSGKLTYDHLVWRDGLPASVKVGTVDGLFNDVPIANQTMQLHSLPTKSVPPTLSTATAHVGKRKATITTRMKVVVGATAIAFAMLMLGVAGYLQSVRQNRSSVIETEADLRNEVARGQCRTRKCRCYNRP